MTLTKLTVNLPGNVPLVLVRCPSGKCLIGSPESERGRFDDEEQREVVIEKDIWFQETPVTQEQYQAVMCVNPSHFHGRPQNPVEMVSWHDACEFCRKLNAIVQEQHPGACAEIRLPTEEEWEYACRAGGAEPARPLDEIAWYCENSNGSTQPVKQKKPNIWGLYDMLGNVHEWTSSEAD